MKTILCTLLFCLGGLLSYGQLKMGDAVTTSSGINSGDKVVKIFDVTNTSAAPAGDNWNLSDGAPVGSNWTLGNLGQVFGLALNNNVNNPHIYVSSTQIYDKTLNGPGWWVNYDPANPQSLGANSKLIWDLDGTSGAYSALCVSTNTEALTTNTSNAIYNNGTGLGNLCFDGDHHQLFVTNMEDGRIYRVDANTGHVLSRFDPFGGYIWANTDKPVFAPLGERLWGIGYSGNTVYYAVWNVDKSHPNPTAYNTIYKVKIDAVTGEFLAMPVSTYEFADPVPTPVIQVPHMQAPHVDPNFVYDWSSAVSDIEFSGDGLSMLVAERTAKEPYYIASTDYYFHYAHRGRVLRYDFTGVSWVPSTTNYFIGNYSNAGSGSNGDISNANCAGGVDFGYEGYMNVDSGDSLFCERYIWASGDALKHPGFPWGISQYVYGIAGIPITGNQNTNNTAADYVRASSLYQDIFGGGNQISKTRPGDVDVLHGCCALEAFVIVPDTACFTDSIDITVGGGPFGRFFVKNQPDGDGVGEVITLPGGSLHRREPFELEPGTYEICWVVYTANPDSTNIWCSDTICFQVTSVLCVATLCDSFIHHNASMVSTPVGGTTFNYYASYNSGVQPQYLMWLVNGQVEQQTTAFGTFTHTFTQGGTSDVCMVAVYILPGENGYSICCYDTICDSTSLDGCLVWKATDVVKAQPDPANPLLVNFTYTNSNPFVPAPTTVVWDFGDGSQEVNNGAPVSHTYANYGSYGACVYIIWQIPELGPNCCCVDTICFKVEATPCQMASFNLNVLDVNQFGNMLSVTSTSPTVIIDNVTWYINGTMMFTSPLNFYRYPTYYSGMHKICVTIQYHMVINGQDVPCARKECWNVYLDQTVFQGIMMQVYPNPTAGDLVVEFSSDKGEPAMLEVYDFMGRRMLQQQITDAKIGVNKIYVNCNDFASGLYEVRLHSGGKQSSSKMIKQ